MDDPSTREDGCLSTTPETPLRGNTAERYPDGGKHAWMIVFGSFCTFFAGLSLLNSIGVYLTWISEHQLRDVSSSRIGWIFGFSNFMSFFAGIPLGPVFDAKGPRPMIAVGSLLLLATYLLLGICHEYWHFFLCMGLLGSLSTCLLFTAAIGAIQHWFYRRRGLATGLAISGGSVGGIVFPLILGKLFPRIGFNWSMRVVCLVMVPFLVFGNLILKGRLYEIEEAIGSRDEKKKITLPDLTILRSPRLAVITLGNFFVELGLFIPVTYVASYSLSHGMTLQGAYDIVTLLSVGSLLGRWIPGYLGDKLGRFNSEIAALSICLISVFGIWLPAQDSRPALRAFVVLFGLGSGSSVSLVPVCIAQLCHTGNYGKTFTSVYSLGSVGSLIGVPLGAVILQVNDGRYSGLIIFSGLAYGVALSCFIAVRVMAAGARMEIRRE